MARLMARLPTVVGSLIVACGAAMSAFADDTEVFYGNTSANTGKPNILLILDTSGSMSSTVSSTQALYDPATTYSGNCGNGTIYYKQGPATAPACNRQGNASGFSSLALSNFVCRAGRAALSSASGQYTDYLIRWQRTTSGGRTTYAWTKILNATNTTLVECLADNGVDGNLASSPAFPVTGSQSSSTAGWTTIASNDVWGCSTASCNQTLGASSYTMFDGNYLNYLANPPTTVQTRLDVVKAAATNLINSMTNVNVGLMRYSDNGGSGDAAAAGGMVAYPVLPVETNRSGLISALSSYDANGWTPLSETLYEAYRYLGGGTVHFGDSSSPFLSVARSRVGNATSSHQYQTPMQYSCQKNYIVYLTDGLPTQDNQADTLIQGLPNFASLGGQCDDTTKSPYDGRDANGNPIPGGWGPSSTAGKCMSALAKYMYSADLSSSLSGQQNVQLYAIGFGDDPALGTAYSWLQKAASNGGGEAYTAGDLSGLTQVLTSIFTNILQTSTTFTAPSVAVNAFNRTQTLSDIYVSVFQPSPNLHWPGNIKKYTVQNGIIVDQNGVAAVDPSTGFFKSTAESFWTSSPDGANVPLGGAASQMPDPASRNVFTYIGANPGSPVALTGAAYAFAATNAAITDAILGIGNPGDPTHADLVNWARGQDVQDDNSNGNTIEARRVMGDPLHSQSAVVIYGGSPSSHNVNDAAVFVATNDGYLHAIDPSTGGELWSFIPQEMLGRLVDLYNDAPQSSKQYGLDGDVRVLKYDVNNDGVVDPGAGDRVYLYFSTGRNSTNSLYYALDVTNKTAPQFMWRLGSSQLPGLGQAWSAPVIAKVNIDGATQNAQKYVLVFGGGYEPMEDAYSYRTTDSVGNRLYMVDAVQGSLLWSAGASGSGATLELTRMDHAIPSSVAALDLDSNGYIDRMYVGDMGGQLWRFDIRNGQTAANLVTGGVIASLGTHDDSTHSDAANRRFYNAPDAALILQRGISPFVNIAIGSGYRGHPLNASTRDRFYAIRDYVPYAPLSQSQYNGYAVVHDADLMDITTNVQPTIPAGSPGWKLLLVNQPSSWIGEKVLAPSLTLNNNIIFTTYTPSSSSNANPCQVSIGQTRAYVVSVLTGAPTSNLENQSNQAPADRSEDITVTGLGSQIALLLTEAGSGESAASGVLTGLAGTGAIFNSNGSRSIRLMIGSTMLGSIRVGSANRTYWVDQSAQ